MAELPVGRVVLASDLAPGRRRQDPVTRLRQTQADPPPTLRQLSDDLLERINRACPEGTGIERENWNRAGRAIEAWLEERGIGR